MNYYAHSMKDDIPAQEYAAHINGVIALAHKYVNQISHYIKNNRFLFSQVVEKAAAFHDLGKLCKDNQYVLSGQKQSQALPINHVDAGVAYFLNERHLSAISAAIVQAHHIGFPDFPAEINKGNMAFRDPSVAFAVDTELSVLERIHNSLVATDFSYTNEDLKIDPSVFYRMALSCVVDADHTETATNYRKYPKIENEILLRAAERLSQLDKYVEGLKQHGTADARSSLRNEMYYACRNANVDSSISSCDSPVGTGKTTAVMAHLLAQAKKRGLRRIFVILPFTNVITQSVDIYRNALTLPGENPSEVIAEIHHRADFESKDARHLTALWRAPIIVTTSVAFFETLASNSTATLRRLHELPGSAIFVDEAHAALPTNLLPLAWKWIQIYASEWSCYWVMASGSINRLWKIPEITYGNNSIDVPEIIDDNLRSRLSVYENNRISYRCELIPKSTEEIANWITNFPGPKLVIMNTVQSAAVLADYIATHFGRKHVEHLSTALTAKDRERTLKRVKSRLKDKEDVDWIFVATSCVEAGVNLSFKTGFRELGSLVSLLQTAGRVNRDGDISDSEMWTFCILEDGMLKTNPGLKQASSILKKYFESGKPITPELSTKSIADEIALYGLSGNHKKLVSNEKILNFRQVECDFKVIDSNTRLTIVDMDVAERLQYGKVDWKELQQVSVQIAKYKLDELKTPIIIDGIYKWNLDYDDFLGYMSGIIKMKKYAGEALII
jgi:CRISPR-associated endonuclease/helicase Cas3